MPAIKEKAGQNPSTLALPAMPPAVPQAELQVLPLRQGPNARLSPFQSLTSETLTAHLAEAEGEQQAAAAAAQLASGSGSAAVAAAALAAEPISRAESSVTAGGSGAAVPDEGAVHDALLIQQFLEGNPSQLTWHGLHALVDGLREEQLAVFFRWGRAGRAEGSSTGGQG